MCLLHLRQHRLVAAMARQYISTAQIVHLKATFLACVIGAQSMARVGPGLVLHLERIVVLGIQATGLALTIVQLMH